MALYTNALKHAFELVQVNKEGSVRITLTLWRVGVIFIALWLSKQPDTMSFEEYVFVAI
jgi:two-component sensor histidine kinase